MDHLLITLVFCREPAAILIHKVYLVSKFLLSENVSAKIFPGCFFSGSHNVSQILF